MERRCPHQHDDHEEQPRRDYGLALFDEGMPLHFSHSGWIFESGPKLIPALGQVRGVGLSSRISHPPPDEAVLRRPDWYGARVWTGSELIKYHDLPEAEIAEIFRLHLEFDPPPRVPLFACVRLPRGLALSSEMEVLAADTPRAYGAARLYTHPQIPIPTFALYLRPESATLAALRCSFHLVGAVGDPPS